MSMAAEILKSVNTLQVRLHANTKAKGRWDNLCAHFTPLYVRLANRFI